MCCRGRRTFGLGAGLPQPVLVSLDAALAVTSGEGHRRQALSVHLRPLLQDGREVHRGVGVGGVGGGEGVCGRLHGRRPPRASVSPLTPGDLGEGGDPRRRGRGRGGALAEADGAAQHALQGAEPRGRRLVQVAVVAARTGATSRGGSAPDEAPASHRRGDVDVHLALDHRSCLCSTGCLLSLHLLLLLLLLVLSVSIIISIVVVILSLRQEKKTNTRTIMDCRSNYLKHRGPSCLHARCDTVAL